MSKVLVIGGGAAGLMAAGIAAKSGSKVILAEKTGSLANKIRISGKGRCNLTNTCAIEEFIPNYPGNGMFLYSALYRFTNWNLINFFSELGVETKVERGGRVFPVTDDADKVADALIAFNKKNKVNIRLNTPITKLKSIDNSIVGAKAASGTEIEADRVIVTTGGASYPKTGSAGDGYHIAKKVGHKVIKPLPALVPLKTAETWVQGLTGLSLRNVELTISNGKGRHSVFGEMQFAHFGVTGPAILTLSRYVSLWQSSEKKNINLYIDLKPALDREVLDQRIQRDFEKYARKQLINGLGDLLPKKLIPIVIDLTGVSASKKINQLTKSERDSLVHVLKELPLTIVNTLPISAAIVTSGGVDVQEINPRTMESKLIKGLYFAGEVINIDGVTGGFNLQAAFSTGYLAGMNVV